MIKFFRKIRQKMLTENKVSKYLLYAIGEIVLVVIGILIALSINNWNENKKLLKEEDKLLQALEREIESNLINLELTIKNNDTIFSQSSVFLMKGLNNPDFEYEMEDIFTILGYNVNNIDTSIINEILGTNSRSLITDDAILEQIRELKKMYEKANKTESYVDSFWNTQVMEYFNTSGLGVYWGGVEIKSENMVVIKLNRSFFSLLGIMNGYQNTLLISRDELKKELKETLTVLNED